jgi:hypothetical protein
MVVGKKGRIGIGRKIGWLYIRRSDWRDVKKVTVSARIAERQDGKKIIYKNGRKSG